MIILGLTGSIGMGKSTAASLFRRQGVPVFDADACVHGLQKPDGLATRLIATAFPGTVRKGHLDRMKLRTAVFASPAALQKLEAIMHPLVRQAQQGWLRAQGLQRQQLVVLDIPLLFEKGGWRGCDVTGVVTAPYHIQRARVLARPGMTEDAFHKILGTQLPDAFKSAHASFLIRSGRGKYQTLMDIRNIIISTRQLTGHKYPAGRIGFALSPRKRKPWP
jgi:dephospho-CoA kinase